MLNAEMEEEERGEAACPSPSDHVAVALTEEQTLVSLIISCSPDPHRRSRRRRGFTRRSLPCCCAAVFSSVAPVRIPWSRFPSRFLSSTPARTPPPPVRLCPPLSACSLLSAAVFRPRPHPVSSAADPGYLL
ncbi:hypothetical protein PVAP13_5KG765050 [Panicum virgatum]|uniref:Uncharacterized protein n=1 Tax=Panicum virgatum TaxID=38727 RepID=A0A8T0SUT3_PANVG|nr:hypothetical protein PVAP13_5KG765050 [Panicum virgatum]